MRLPPNYPLYDVQCIGCSFRAQVKFNSSTPMNEIFGATWEIMNKVLKAGFIAPPLFVVFQPKNEKPEIRFYPFIPKGNMKWRKVKIKKTERKLKMFNYVGMNDMNLVPYFIVYPKPKE